jgi:hypothetical protein
MGGRSPDRGRVHRLLVRRYLDGLAPTAVQRELGLARSQYYAEHGRSVAAVTSVLGRHDFRATPTALVAGRTWRRSAAQLDPLGAPTAETRKVLRIGKHALPGVSL